MCLTSSESQWVRLARKSWTAMQAEHCGDVHLACLGDGEEGALSRQSVLAVCRVWLCELHGSDRGRKGTAGNGRQVCGQPAVQAEEVHVG